MNPYSLDLRQRAIALYREDPCYSRVAKTLKVSHVWVRNMVRLWNLTGTLNPQYQNCGRPPALGEREKQCLRQWLEEENGLTLKELGGRLAKQGLTVSHTTIDNALRAMKITRKKNDHRRGKKPTGRS